MLQSNLKFVNAMESDFRMRFIDVIWFPYKIQTQRSLRRVSNDGRINLIHSATVFLERPIPKRNIQL